MDRYDTPDARSWQPLLDAAAAARANAHAPYSRYTVGAALACEDGSIVAGCNVENATYGATVCAERNAIGHAIATGRRRFLACLVITPGERPGPPCGICRQVLSEFAEDLPILLVSESGARTLVRLAQIFPGSFGPSFLSGG
jgi:cytidine deaminase